MKTKFIIFAAILLVAAGVILFIFIQGKTRLTAPDVVILVTIDTLRADHLGCYGYPRNTSPFLDRLAAGGVIFRNALSSSSHTTPSHASIFTSLHPVQHKALMNGTSLPGAVLTMAEIFDEAGYETAGFFSVNYLEGIGQGFDIFDWSTDQANYYTRTADRTVDNAIGWLRQQKPASRLFLWIHFFDVHAPNRNAPDPGLEKALESEDEKKEFINYLAESHGIPRDFYKDEQSLFRTFNGYDSEIAFVDRELERLWGMLEEEGLNDNALWIITSDHGEGLGNHNYIEHSKKIYNEQLRVPLIITHGGGKIKPVNVEALVKHVDLLPTLCELLGFPLKERSETIQGESLVPMIQGDSLWPAPRYAFSQRRPRGKRRGGWEPGKHYALQDRNYKYILHSEGPDEFFCLTDDPFEAVNLIDVDSEEKERMKTKLSQYYSQLFSESKFSAQTGIKPKYIKTLKSLGYL